MLCADVEPMPPGGLDGGRDRERNQSRVREVVARVVKEAIDRTKPRSARRVGELLFDLGYESSKKPGEAISEGSVRAWGNGRDRPLAEVIIALALYHELSIDEYLWGDRLRQRMNVLEEIVFGMAAQVYIPLSYEALLDFGRSPSCAMCGRTLEEAHRDAEAAKILFCMALDEGQILCWRCLRQKLEIPTPLR